MMYRPPCPLCEGAGWNYGRIDTGAVGVLRTIGRQPEKVRRVRFTVKLECYMCNKQGRVSEEVNVLWDQTARRHDGKTGGG